MFPLKDHTTDQLTAPELKEELEKRNLPTQGAKAALIARLRDAMKSEGDNVDVDEDSDLEMGTKKGEADEKQQGSSNPLMQMLLAIQNSMEKQSTEIYKKLDQQLTELKADLDKQSTEINMKLDQQSIELKVDFNKQSTELEADLKTRDEKLDTRIKKSDEQISTVTGKLKMVYEKMKKVKEDLAQIKIMAAATPTTNIEEIRIEWKR